MIIQKKFDFLLQFQFCNIFTSVLSISFPSFTNILKIYEEPKMHNTIPKYSQTFALTIFIYQANSMLQQHLAFELYPS